MTAPLDSALSLAAAGLRVFPLKPNAKTPLTEHGCLDAALDEAQIRAWWQRWPGANIGVATGQGFFVLDVDPRHGGNESLAALEREHGALPATREALTGGGGRHLHFTAPDGTEIRNSAGKLGAGLDVKSAGGYVVAPPSIHPSGALYAWAEGRGLDCPLALAPGWLLALLTRPTPAAPAPTTRAAPNDGRFSRARAYLAKLPAAVSGQDGHGKAWKAALSVVRGFDLEPGAAYDLLASDFNVRCAPPWSEQELRHKIQGAHEKGKLPRGYLLNDSAPCIRVGLDEARVVNEAIAALARDPDTYQRGTNLVRIIAHADTEATPAIRRETGAPLIDLLPGAWVEVRLSEHARWEEVKTTKKEATTKRCRPPSWAVQAVATAGTWPGVRRLEAVIETPFVRPDGTICAVAGYDAATGLLLHPLGRIEPVPESPTRADALKALEELLDVVSDFPFEQMGHRAAWIAATLTPLLRPAYSGPSPLFLFDANVRSSGKSLLARAAATVSMGRQAATMTWPAEKTEQKKLITSLALDGTTLILLDNLEGILGGSELNAALTSTTWADRILGLSKTTGTLPLKAIWFATGNNATLGADTARRTIHIRLASPLEKPEERQGFSHPDLATWVRAERPRLVRAALLLCRAWFVAGQPETTLRAMGSFEGWALVRQIVSWAGLPDPALTQVGLAEVADRELSELHGLVAGLASAVAKQKRAVTVRELLAFAAPLSVEGAGLRDTLLEFCPGHDGDLPKAVQLAGRLRHFSGRVIGDGRAIEAAPGRSGVAHWTVRQVVKETPPPQPSPADSGGVGGHGGVSQSQRARENQSDPKSLADGAAQPSQPHQPNQVASPAPPAGSAPETGGADGN